MKIQRERMPEVVAKDDSIPPFSNTPTLSNDVSSANPAQYGHDFGSLHIFAPENTQESKQTSQSSEKGLNDSINLVMQRSFDSGQTGKADDPNQQNQVTPGQTTPNQPSNNDPNTNANANTSGTVDPLEGTAPNPKIGGDSVEGSSEQNNADGLWQVQANLEFYEAGVDQRYLGTVTTKHDPVNGALNLGSQIARGGVTIGADNFGEERAQYKADNIHFTADAARKVVNISARMLLDIHWDVNSHGKTHISGPTDAAVTSTTWRAIADDLRPDGTGRPTRATYWAQDLTERHEQFHASDDISRARIFLPTAQAFVSAQTVDTSKDINPQVSAHIEQARTQVEADGWAYYGTGGENRAYADGKAQYQARTAAIEARAKTEKWA
jgi:hypothetical protein